MAQLPFPPPHISGWVRTNPLARSKTSRRVGSGGIGAKENLISENVRATYQALNHCNKLCLTVMKTCQALNHCNTLCLTVMNYSTGEPHITFLQLGTILNERAILPPLRLRLFTGSTTLNITLNNPTTPTTLTIPSTPTISTTPNKISTVATPSIRQFSLKSLRRLFPPDPF